MKAGQQDSLAAQANEESSPKKEPVTLEEPEGCFDSLATAAVTGKDFIEALLKNNTLLTKTNVKLSAVIKLQAAEIKSLTAGGGIKGNMDTRGLVEMKTSQISRLAWRIGAFTARKTLGMTRMTVMS